MTKMRLGEKKEKTEGETECFLVSSGGLALFEMKIQSV